MFMELQPYLTISLGVWLPKVSPYLECVSRSALTADSSTLGTSSSIPLYTRYLRTIFVEIGSKDQRIDFNHRSWTSFRLSERTYRLLTVMISYQI